jgi:uncharacterized protein YbjT (DUF2867 family)
MPGMTSNDCPRTVLVIGASGGVGRHVVDGLLGCGLGVRALVRDPATVRLPAVVELVRGDLHDPASVAAAAGGCDAAFLLWMGFSADGATDTVGALTGEVGHVVYLSAARLQGDTQGVTPGVWADVEALVHAAADSWTFVRGGGFATNTLGWADQVRAGNTVALPYPDAARSWVHEHDLGDVVVQALTDPERHRGRAYAVTGPEVLTQRELVASLAQALGRPLAVREQPYDEALAELSVALGPDYASSALAYWSTLVDRPERVSPDGPGVTGRPARTYHRWVHDHLKAFTDT